MPPGRISAKSLKQVAAKRRATAAKTTGPIEPAPLDVAMDQAAQKFLDDEPQLRGLNERIQASPNRFITEAADVVSKISRMQHLKALAFAYSVWLRATHNEAFANYVAALRRQRPNKRTTDLHLIAQAMVTYGSPEPEDRQAKRGLYQRDVAALRYLHSQSVGPDELEDRATKAGEGLDAWARRWPTVKNAGASGNSQTVKVRPDIEIIVRVTAPDGAATTERYAFADNEDGQRLLSIIRDTNNAPSQRDFSCTGNTATTKTA